MRVETENPIIVKSFDLFIFKRSQSLVGFIVFIVFHDGQFPFHTKVHFYNENNRKRRKKGMVETQSTIRQSALSTPFGGRLLDDKDKVFEQNAWDNVPFDEEQEREVSLYPTCLAY